MADGSRGLQEDGFRPLGRGDIGGARSRARCPRSRADIPCRSTVGIARPMSAPRGGLNAVRAPLRRPHLLGGRIPPSYDFGARATPPAPPRMWTRIDTCRPGSRRLHHGHPGQPARVSLEAGELARRKPPAWRRGGDGSHGLGRIPSLAEYHSLCLSFGPLPGDLRGGQGHASDSRPEGSGTPDRVGWGLAWSPA